MPTYYIRVDGNDANTGLTNSPSGAWRNLSRANSAPVTAGDTILVNDGTYSAASGGVVMMTNGVAGQLNLPITLKSLNKYGAKVLVPLNVNGANRAFDVQRSYWTFDGFEVYCLNNVDPGSNASIIGFYCRSATTGCIIRNCKVHDIATGISSAAIFGFAGFFIGDTTNVVTNLTIEDCQIYSVGRKIALEGGQGTGNKDHGIYVDHSQGLTIRRNVFWDCVRGWPIHFYPEASNLVTVVNNTFDGVMLNGAGGQILFAADNGGLTNATFKNNIFYNTGIAPFNEFTFGHSQSGCVLDYNLTNDPGPNPGNWWISGNVPSGVTMGTHSVMNSNPLFVDAANHDYRLTAASPARGMGENQGWGTDVGAYQFVALGNTYYVSLTGSDSNPGSQAFPKRTFSAAVALLGAGDTLYVRTGTYTERFSCAGKSGNSNAPITLSGYPGETVILSPIFAAGNVPIANGGTSWWIFKDFQLNGDNGPTPDGTNTVKGWYMNNVQNTVFQNLEITRLAYNGLYLENSSGNTIRGCHIHHLDFSFDIVGARFHGVYYHDGNNILAENNHIHHCPGAAFQIYPGAINGFVCRNNTIHDCNMANTANVGGIVIGRNDAESPRPGLVQNVQVYNNLIYNNVPPVNIDTDGLRIFGVCSNVSFWNNAIYGHVRYGINIQNFSSASGPAGAPANTLIQNNIAYGNQTRNPGINNNIVVASQATGTVQSTNINTANPLYTNAAAGDFTVQAGSPAIDGGTTLAAFSTDILGVSRPQGAAWDIGPYEKVGSGDVVPPTAPPSIGANVLGETDITVSWTAASDNVGVIGYRVQRCQGAACTGFTTIATLAGLSFPDTGLSPGTTYRYQVQAFDASGNSGPFSSIVTATTLPHDTTPPSAPTGLRILG